LSPVTQSLAAPGAPGASPLRAGARTGEARTGAAPNAKASVAAEPSVMTVRIRARMICTSVVAANRGKRGNPKARVDPDVTRAQAAPQHPGSSRQGRCPFTAVPARQPRPAPPTVRDGLAGDRVREPGPAMTGQADAHTNRPELVAIHGYDTKYAMRALRLGCKA
jgi:hypothetical protein